MKVSLIAIHGNGNYGSVLQTMTTQLCLEEEGLQVEVVDYRPERYSVNGLLKRLRTKNKYFSDPIFYRVAQLMMLPSYLKKVRI